MKRPLRLALISACALLMGASAKAEDCSQIYDIARKILVPSARMVLNIAPSEGGTCQVQLRDSGRSNAPIGTLVVTVDRSRGSSLSEYRRPEDAIECQKINGVGQMGDTCFFSESYDHEELTTVIYLEQREVLKLHFLDWPAPRNSALAQAQSLASEILRTIGPLGPAQPLSKETAAEAARRRMIPESQILSEEQILKGIKEVSIRIDVRGTADIPDDEYRRRIRVQLERLGIVVLPERKGAAYPRIVLFVRADSIPDLIGRPLGIAGIVELRLDQILQKELEPHGYFRATTWKSSSLLTSNLIRFSNSVVKACDSSLSDFANAYKTANAN
jgi:hypothetical protein